MRRIQSNDFRLGEAIKEVLASKSLPQTAGQITADIAARGIYKRRDGNQPSPGQVAREISRQGSQFWSVQTDNGRVFGLPHLERQYNGFVEQQLSKTEWARGLITRVHEARDRLRCEIRESSRNASADAIRSECRDWHLIDEVIRRQCAERPHSDSETQLSELRSACANYHSYLFEMRFAYELTAVGAVPEYEYHAASSDSTVDFMARPADVRWLFELVSIEVSDVIRREMKKVDQELVLGSDNQENNQLSIEYHVLKVQEKICEKAWSRSRDGSMPGHPIKFPPPAPGQMHVIVANVSDFLGPGDGGGPAHYAHYIEVAYAGMEQVRHLPWATMKWKPGGKAGNPPISGDPILGLFNPEARRPEGAATIRERIHFVVFVDEPEYRPGLMRRSWWAWNPHLFNTENEAAEAWRRSPFGSRGRLLTRPFEVAPEPETRIRRQWRTRERCKPGSPKEEKPND